MSEPTRFREGGADVPPELARLFEAGANDLPSEGDLRRLAARLGPVFEPPPGGSGFPGWPTVGKVAALSAVVAGSAVFFALNFGPHTPRPPDVPDSVPAPPELAPAPSGVPALTSAPAPSEGTSGDALPPAPGAPSASSAPRPTAGAARPAETEAELLERARNALSANPARALALTEQHRAHFPAGVLAQEREVIAIQALKRLGRTDEAAERSAAFARRYPNSAYRKKLNPSSP
jgi:hypothetical protein